MADTLKHRVYAAQSWITGAPNWTSVKDAAAFIRYMERHVEFVRRYPDHKAVTIYRLKDPGAPQAYYRGSNHGIYLPYWAQNGATLVHELTHAVTRNDVSHGAVFCRHLHWMVGTMLGSRMADELALGFDENGIRALAYDDAGKRSSA